MVVTVGSCLRRVPLTCARSFSGGLALPWMASCVMERDGAAGPAGCGSSTEKEVGTAVPVVVTEFR